MSGYPFWMIWNPARFAPKAQHQSEQSAIDEASRLALGNPGEVFIVLHATHRVSVKAPVQIEKLELPF